MSPFNIADDTLEGLIWRVYFMSVISAASSDLTLLCSHLQAGDGEAASVVRQCGDGDDERGVWDVFVVEFYGNFIITWRRDRRANGRLRIRKLFILSYQIKPVQDSELTWLLNHVGHSTGSVLPVLKGDLGLAGSFHSNGETSSSGLSGPDTELS